MKVWRAEITSLVSSRWVKVVVSMGLILYIVSTMDLGEISADIRLADRGLFVFAIFMFIVSGVVGALQWETILRFHGVRLGKIKTVSHYFMGLFFNFVLPGFVGGDVVRVYKTSIASGRSTQAFSSTLADRVIGLAVLILFSIGAVVFMPEGPARGALPIAVAIFFVLLVFLGVFAWKPAGRFLGKAVQPFATSGMIEKLRAVYLEMHELSRSPATLASVVVLSVLIQFTRIGVHYLCGRAVGIELGFGYYALFVPIMAIVASLPVSIGGFGVREASAVVLLGTVGIHKELVISYSILATIASFAGALPGGIAFAMSGGKDEG